VPTFPLERERRNRDKERVTKEERVDVEELEATRESFRIRDSSKM